jgi:acetate kinase
MALLAMLSRRSSNDDVISGIEELDELAPLHNASAAAVIRASRSAFGPSIPQISVFDTAFHRTIPDHARYYAIPWELAKRYGIQRFGFHGISHNYLLLRYAEITQTPLEQRTLSLSTSKAGLRPPRS